MDKVVGQQGLPKKSGLDYAEELLELVAPLEWQVYLETVEEGVDDDKELADAEEVLRKAAPAEWKQYKHEVDLASRSIMNRLKWELAEAL